MKKINLIALGIVATMATAFVSPASAFSLGAAMHDVGRTTKLAAAVPPNVSLKHERGCSFAGKLCWDYGSRSETFENSLRYAIYRTAPDHQILTGSVPVLHTKSSIFSALPALMLGEINYPALPPMLRANTDE